MGRPKGYRNIYVADPIVDVLDGLAEAADVGTAPMVEAVLLGVIRRGQVERFMEIGAEADEGIARRLSKRRARAYDRRWESSGAPMADEESSSSGKVPTGSGVWSSGPWSIRYLGDVKAGKSRRPGTGWHLYGPGILVGIHVGWTKRDALDAANVYVDRYEAAEAAQGVEGPDTAPEASEANSGEQGGQPAHEADVVRDTGA